MALVTFKLLDRKTDESSFFLNQDGTKDEDRKLDFTNTYGVLNPFWVNVEGIRKYFQYIEGCGIFDPAEQKKQGIIPNMQNSDIHFNKGADIILSDETMKPLIDFLSMHPTNTKSSYHKPDQHDAKFYTFDPKELIKVELDVATAEDKAFEILYLLKKDKERMRSLALLFDETKGLSDDDEIYMGLRAIVKNKPETFTASIANKENEVLSQVLKAQTGPYGLIGKDAKGYFYEDDKTVIFSTTTKQKAIAEAELVSYLMSAEGDTHYRQLLVKLQKKEIDLMAPVGDLG